MSSLDKYIVSDKFITDKLNSISKEAKEFYEKQKNYEDFVSCQKPGFFKLMHYINKLLSNYIDSGKISSFVEFRARIKAPSSAIINDSKKSLDDVFGMELICATENEIDFLIKEITGFMKTLRFKNHDKDNGYKAKHYSLYLDPSKFNLLYPNKDVSINSEKFEEENSKVPLVEFQFKTIEVAIKSSDGSAAHSTYKNVDIHEIQTAFDKHELQRGNNLPYMWVSSMKSSNKPTMKELNDDEVAKKLYPFLNTNRQREI